jgi:hypothetical protein
VASFTTPCTVVMGVVSQKAVYVEVDGGKRVEEPVGVDLESAEPRVDGEFLSGHLAFTSFGTTIVKAVALGRSAYVLDLGGLRPLMRKAVTTRSVKDREFGSWEQVWNKPIFLSDRNPTVAVGASRAGALLHLNAVPSDVELAKKVWAVAGVLQKAGALTLNCVCRLGLMPVEIAAIRGNRYVLAKFYLNASSPRNRKVFFIMGEGGNVIQRMEVDVAEAEAAAYELLKYVEST